MSILDNKENTFNLVPNVSPVSNLYSNYSMDWNNPMPQASNFNMTTDTPAQFQSWGTDFKTSPDGIFGGNPAFSMKGFAGGIDPTTSMKYSGWGIPAFGIAKSGLEAWLASQQLGVARDSLDFQKNAFSKQFENQRKLTNTEMRDRQTARVSAGPGYESVDSYMKKNGV